MTVKLRDFFAHYKGEPHQLAAVELLQSAMPQSLLQADTPWVETFRAAPKAKPPLQQNGMLLKVPYYSQRDSGTEHAYRMCFSSSCAMLLAAVKPGTLTGANGDDQYLKRVLQYGDTTDAGAQIQALNSYGIKARLEQHCTWDTLEQQLNKGTPVPCGFLHHGSVNNPTGGGHWLTVIGYTKDAVIVNDPFGELNLVTGSYTSSKGAGLSYSRKNWGPRWMPEGSGSGWAILIER